MAFALSAAASHPITAQDALEGAVSWSSSGELEFRVFQDTVEDTEYEDHRQYFSRALWENEVRLEGSPLRVQINAEAVGEAWSGDESREDADVFLHEAYASYVKGAHAFTVGRQVVTWGRIERSRLDVWNPQSYRWFVLFDKQRRKRAVLMSRYEYIAPRFDLEFVWMPWFEPSQLLYFGSDWALFDHTKKIIREEGYPPAVKSLVNAIEIRADPEREKHALTNSQGGARLRSRAGDIDYALYYLNVAQNLGVLQESTPKGNLVKQFLYLPSAGNLNRLLAAAPAGDDLILRKEHPRMHLIGADAETVWGVSSVRAELAYATKMAYLREDFSYAIHDTLFGACGADYTGSGGLYLNIDFLYRQILGYRELFADEEYTFQVDGTLRKDLWRGSAEFVLDGSFNFSRHDWMINPVVTWKANPSFHVSAGMVFFGGDLTTLFGRFDQKDLVYVRTQYFF
ncbi:MAG: hypothetical protein GF333_03180 [Candidatus Omnitrophica bacterium]|nr:hypothetical protein [Candidatus Omnitrophota bacterium]